jgi:hypothetical protein
MRTNDDILGISICFFAAALGLIVAMTLAELVL